SCGSGFTYLFHFDENATAFVENRSCGVGVARVGSDSVVATDELQDFFLGFVALGVNNVQSAADEVLRHFLKLLEKCLLANGYTFEWVNFRYAVSAFGSGTALQRLSIYAW